MKYIFLLLLFLALLFQGCCKDHNDPQLSDDIRRTVLVYVAGQNSLSYSGEQLQDSLEIMQGAAHLSPHDRLLLFIDDQQAPRLYEVARGYSAPKRVRSWSEDVNSADAETLKDVLLWTKTHYPSKEYGLVLWSHATGWVYGERTLSQSGRLVTTSSISPKSFGIDVGPDGDMRRDRSADGKWGYEMDIESLADAIESSNIRFRYILFDCCLMQGIEVCYALRHCADYLGGSPIAISAEGGYYTDLMKNGLFAANISDLGDAYMQYYLGGNSPLGMVFSIVRTDRLEALAKTVAEVLPSCQKDADTHETRYWELYPTLHYAGYARNFFYRPHYYDFQEVFRKVLPESDFQRVKAALDDAIVYRNTTSRFWTGPGSWHYTSVQPDQYCGLSLFVPQAIYTSYSTATPHGDHNLNFRRTEWYRAAGWEEKGW